MRYIRYIRYIRYRKTKTEKDSTKLKETGLADERVAERGRGKYF